jgi:DNA-binding beta-propeller fold protein YncE
MLLAIALTVGAVAAPAGLPSLLPSFGQASAQQDVTLWITLGDIDQLVEADPYTFKEIRRITTDPKLHGLAFSPDGSKVYLASDRTGNFQVVDVRKGAVVEQINIGKDPNQMAITKDGRFAYVPMRGEDAVAVVQLQPLKLLKKIPMDKGPHDGYITPDGTRVFVGAQFGRSVAVIDPARQELLYSLPTVDGVRPIRGTRDGRTLYVALSNLIGFVVVDAEKGVTRRVELGTLPENIPRPYLDTFTHDLHLSPDESELWVSDDVFDLIRIVRLSDMKEIHQIHVGHFPHWFTMRPDGKVVFVSLWYSDAVAAIDTATRRVLGHMQFARQSGPKRIGIAPKVK